MCVNYDLCFKCHSSRAVIHRDHEFRELGYEFEEDLKEVDQSDKDSSSDTTSSDDDSDSDNNE